MPQKGDRRGQVLHWDEVYGQYARAAASMPVEEVDRELAAMGYDLDRLNGAISRLGRRTGAHADGASMACREERADASLLPLLQPAPHVVANATGAGRHHGGWRRGARRAVAGVAAVALLALLAVPISETSLGRLPTALIAQSDKPAHVRIAEANPAGFAQERDANSDSPDIANLPNAKVAPSEKCEGVDVQAEAVAAGDKLAKTAADEMMPIADDGAGAPAGTEDAKRPRLIAMARGQGPASVG